MKLYVGKDYSKDRGYFLVHLKDGSRYYYNKITKDFEVKNTIRDVGDDMYYIDFKTLAGLLSWADGCKITVSPDIQNDQLRDFVATLNFIPPKESQAATDSFELYGAL
jgi:hypothetical protein